MIRVIRTAPPAMLESRRIARELDIVHREADDWTSHLRLSRAVQDERIKAALTDMFANKCAYCERYIDTAEGVVEHYRPVRGAMSADGSISERHYSWLADAWTNLLLSCSTCNRNKANRFPVSGRRAEPGADLAEEGALLLNPCDDEPDSHLVFLADGTVVSDTARGQATIEILALNRNELIEERRRQANLVLFILKDRGADAPELRRLLGPDLAYAGMSRQLVRAQTAGGRTASVEHRVKAQFNERESERQHYSLVPDSEAMGEVARQRYFGSAKWIERISLKNFRAMRSLTLDMSRSTSGNAPWTVLLGENGTGKTSVLQALALALMGERQRSRLVPDASRNVRRGATQGSVEVYLTGKGQPLRIRFWKGQIGFEGPDIEPVLLLGYGSTRLPAYGAATPAAGDDVVRVDNLFNPLLPITDPTQWLLSLDDALFDRVSKWLGQLLAFKAPQRLVRDNEASTIELRAGRSRASLDQLGDGYQSMLILACDVMRTLLPLWQNDLEQAEGIVLIDELGTHLHPRWRMRIVEALRRVLPRVQFIATTHDPLCLRGLEDGEVTVLRRDEKQNIVSISDLPPVKALRVEQLLASDFFGLGSTHDPEVDDLYDEYYRLLGRRSLSPKQRKRLARIERQLMELDQLGTTEQERLVFRAAGDYIAQRRATGDGDHAQRTLDDDVRHRLMQLWSANLPSPPDES
jgi:uncharacterized protein (TIGR02646 family)